MSTNKTPLGLNHWTTSDKPVMAEFNEDNQIIDQKLQELSAAASLFAAPEMHRNIFRGKNLGTAVTDEQIAAIRDGSFADLYVGDYWTINGKIYRIVDINYWLGCGDTEFKKPHLLIMPDAVLYNAVMNSTNVTTGGYVGSQMYTANLANAKSTISADFPGLVLTHRELLTNAVTNGYPSAGGWYDSTVELPSEIMMYGSQIIAPANNGVAILYNYTINKQQLALFAMVPKFIGIRVNYWLRDVVSASTFANVGRNGDANTASASISRGVRPVFCIG